MNIPTHRPIVSPIDCFKALAMSLLVFVLFAVGFTLLSEGHKIIACLVNALAFFITNHLALERVLAKKAKRSDA
jgi:hypothetical protein